MREGVWGQFVGKVDKLWALPYCNVKFYLAKDLHTENRIRNPKNLVVE